MQGRCIICHSCGKEAEHRMGLLPCEELNGWLTISYWKGKESVDHYNFCSLPCLQEWLSDQIPQIPKVFLESFNEEEG